MTIRYLLDVDYTLMVTSFGSTFYNQNLINELKRVGVKEVDFLTKMDVFATSPNKPLRVELINHLEKNGIRVRSVLTTLDTMFIKSGYFSNLSLGDTYQSLMKPVEEAVVAVAKIKDYESRYKQYKAHKAVEKKIKLLDFLIQHQALVLTDSIEEASKKEEASIKAINQIIIDQTITKGNELNFYSILNIFAELRECVKQYPEKAKTFTIKAFYEELVETYTNYQAPEDNTLEEQQLIDTYLSELGYYEDIRYIASLRYRNAAPMAQEHDGKGNIYTQLVTQNTYQKDDIVIFVDDTLREQQSLENAHKALTGYNHVLHTLLPPIQGDAMQFNQGPESQIPLEEFRKQHSKIYFDMLCKEGDLALTSKNSRLAVQCYKAAYILLDDLGQTAPVSKQEMLGKIIQAYKQNDDHVFSSEREDMINQCVFAFNRGGSEIKLRVLEREQAIHEARNPNLYKAKGFSLNRFIDTEPKSVDSEFMNKILGLAKEIHAENESSPTILKCLEKFLSSLKNCVRYSSYREVVKNVGEQDLKIQFN
ncbi:hypothetical protein [Legionella clemsonensis]|uniref:Uncharacterized protein n=1 Tax=Legionella clemsonensis TaxID=1867846 RepID=A0A222P5H7_9GAMM|nr:hypothetical protein [Legionella clemsonensis]ASQ47106.1 hypothetical protein clem_12860 [Legionella clemsonensis]